MTQTSKRAIGIGIVLAAAVAIYTMSDRGQEGTKGEEPPIRVKNGTVTITPDGTQWAARGFDPGDVWDLEFGQAWIPSANDVNSQKAFTVTVWRSAGSAPSSGECPDGARGEGHSIALSYDGNELTLKARSGHSKVRPKAAGNLSNNNTVLTYGVSTSFVGRVRVWGGKTDLDCTLRDTAALYEITICPGYVAHCAKK